MYVQQYGQLENNHWWFVIRQKIILNTLRKFIREGHANRLKILNVGAAAGGSSKWLSELGDIISLENDPLFLEYLSSQDVVVINGSVTGIPLEDDRFDLVCAFDVIEHVENDQKAVEELVRVCRPGGSIFITVPAFQSIWGNHDIVNGHQRRYRRKQLQNLAFNQPATVLYSSYFNCILFVPIFLFRKIHLLFRKKSPQIDSDFAYFKTNGFVNKILKMIFGTELLLLRSIRLPFGVSLMVLIRKNPSFEVNSQKKQTHTH